MGDLNKFLFWGRLMIIGINIGYSFLIEVVSVVFLGKIFD